MEAAIMQILQAIIMVVVPVATSALTYFVKQYVTAFIDKKAKAETAENLKKGLDVIIESIDYVQQTYVNELKKTDTFSIESQKEAFGKAKDRAVELMNTDIVAAIEGSYGDLDKYIETVIESYINKKKA